MSPASQGGAPISLRRVYLLLCGSLALQALGQSAMFAVLPSIGRKVGLLPIQVGAIITASSIVFFFAGPYWGRMSDRLGRRKVFLIGQGGYVLGGSLFAISFWLALNHVLAPLLAWICMIGARMTQASLMSASAPSAGAYIADITGPGSRAKGLARIGAANNLGSIVGPAVGGGLAAISLLAPFTLAVCSVALAALLSYFFLPYAPQQAASGARPKVRFGDRRVVRWIVPGIVMFMAAAVVQQTLSFRIQDALHLNAAKTAAAFGSTMMASAVAGLIAQTVIVQRVRLTPANWLALGLPLIACGLFGMGFFESLPGFVCSNVATGLGMAFAGSGFNAGASLAVTAEEQGAVAGITSACTSAGWIVGPLLGPGLYQLHPHLPFMLTAVVVAAAAVFAGTSLRRAERRGAQAREGAAG